MKAAAEMPRNTSITRGAILTITMRWIDRLIGIISTLILARILVPEDFGIVAMASIVVGLADIIFDLGVNIAVIQKHEPSQAFYDTAWTVKIVQSSCVALLLIAAAPFAADYYADPRVTAVIQVMALSLFVASFENVGIITFQKQLDFVADVKFVFVKRIVGFACTIVLTVVLESYWGMVIGALCGRLASTLMSYVAHPMRPQFSLAHFAEIFSISQWVLVKNISQYLDRTLHIVVVGGIAKAGVTGGYTLAVEISGIPGNDLLAPINRVLFPAFARVRDDYKQLSKLLISAQGVQVMVTVPACAGLALTANEFIPVALGEKWLFIIPFIQILALSNIIQSVNSSANYVLTVIGQIRVLALASWLQIAAFVIGLLIFRQDIDPESIARIRFASIALTCGVSFLMLKRYLPELSLRSVGAGIVRPAVACMAMAVALKVLDIYIVVENTVLLLAIKIAVGVAVYMGTVLALWTLALRPDGAERYFISKLSRKN